MVLKGEFCVQTVLSNSAGDSRKKFSRVSDIKQKNSKTTKVITNKLFEGQNFFQPEFRRIFSQSK